MLRFWALILVLCATFWSSGSSAAALEDKPKTKIGDAAARDTQGSAYALPTNTWGVDVGLLGSGINDLYANVGVNYGIKYGLQAGINLAHLSSGLINLNLKWNFWERGPFALAVRFSPTWIHGDWVWVLRIRPGPDVISSVDALVLSSSAVASYRPFEMFQFDLGARYTGSRVYGDLSSESVLLDAQLAAQQFAFEPKARLYWGDGFTLTLGARLPVWTRIPGSVDAEIELGDGVIAGGSSGGELSPKFKDVYQISLDARAMVKDGTFVNLGLSYGNINKQVYGAALYPQMGLEFRF